MCFLYIALHLWQMTVEIIAGAEDCFYLPQLNLSQTIEFEFQVQQTPIDSKLYLSYFMWFKLPVLYFWAKRPFLSSQLHAFWLQMHLSYCIAPVV